MPYPEPALVLTTLDDGCIRLTYGPLTGTVSSHHLVPSKAAQLHEAWLAWEAAQEVLDRNPPPEDASPIS